MENAQNEPKRPAGNDSCPAKQGQDGKARERRLLIVAASLVIVLAGVVIVAELWPEPAPPRPPTKAFYTVDDGASFFVDNAERLPPFDHGGKPAVRAFLFSCDGGKTRFTGFLEKLPEEALQKLVDEGRDLKFVDDDDVAATSGWLTKRPGEKAWINSKIDPAKYAAIRKVTCRGGGNPAPVYPDESK